MRRRQLGAVAIGAIVALFLIVAVCLPLFLNADNFRTRIEATLTDYLGRPFRIQTTDVINKLTENDYMARMRAILRQSFAEWFDDTVLSQHQSLHSHYGYDATLCGTLFATEGLEKVEMSYIGG